jgi:hypothetical protein
MRTKLASLLLMTWALLFTLGCPTDDDDSGGDDDAAQIPDWTLGTILDTEAPGVLAELDGSWGDKLYIVRVEGSEYEMGYQYGRLQGQMMLDMWWSYIMDLGEELGATNPDEADYLIGMVLDKVWANFEPHTTDEWLTRIQGVADGMEAADCDYDPDLLTFVHRILSMGEMAVSSHMAVGSLLGLTHLLDNGISDELAEWYGRSDGDAARSDGTLDDDALATAFELLTDPAFQDDGEIPLFNCSSYAAWGDRTEGGALFTMRNMDFSSDTGIYKWANIAAFVPDEGIPYVSTSWVGMTLGAGLAGVNQEGVFVGNAQSNTPMERFNVESAMLRGARLLQGATDLESAMPFFSQQAPTVGVAGVIAYGDASGGGAEAEAVAFELNGASMAVFRNHHDCSVDTTLYRYDYDGILESTWTDQTHPEWANLEADAVEIDGEGEVRYFQCNDPCETQADLVLDNDGDPIEVAGPGDGMPIQTGYTMPCAVYRGDSQFANGLRIHQEASHGPVDGGDGLMITAGAYKERYRPFQTMTEAYEQGSSFSAWDQEWIEETGSQQLIGLDQVEDMARVAAMRSSNVWAFAFDTTNLVIRASFESGTGDTWVGAHDQPPFLEIDLREVFLTD